MADEGNVISNLDLGPDANGEDTSPVAGIISQYVRDLSVENPNAPECFQWQDAPEVDVQFNIGADNLTVSAIAREDAPAAPGITPVPVLAAEEKTAASKG